MLQDEALEYIEEQYNEKNMVLSAFGREVNSCTLYEDVFGDTTASSGYHSALSSFNRLCGRYCYRCGLSYLPWSKQGV